MFGPTKKQLYRDITRQREHYERIIADLQDRLADAHGRPWTPAPADVKTPGVSTTDEPVSFTFAPEQHVTY